jgi:hypothetical protein
MAQVRSAVGMGLTGIRRLRDAGEDFVASATPARMMRASRTIGFARCEVAIQILRRIVAEWSFVMQGSWA